MTTYIALLRGINVSGKNLIKMDALKLALKNIGFEDVQTYIQSGNIVFKSVEADVKILEKRIIDPIKNSFSLTVPCMVFMASDFKRIVMQNPFAESQNQAFLHLSFLSDKPLESNIQKLKDIPISQDAFEIIENCIYLYCPQGYGSTKLSNTTLESKLKVTATTRNLNTCLKLIELSA
jgi:uncharacterized protein (DUF1697 family)